MEKQTFSGNYEADIASLNLRLRVSESFDLVSRQIMIGSHRAMLWFIDGFIKDGLMEKIMSFMMNADEKKLKTVGTTREFADAFVPYVETEVVNDFDRFETFLFSGALGMIVDGFKEAIIIDVRTYPARSVDEPENDKVLRGSHDGFVETLIFNTALIRRRVRDTKLTMYLTQIGKRSKTDVVLCYLDGTADPKEVEKIKKKLNSIDINALTMGHESLAECLIPKQRFNPFPKVRYTERPDSAVASIYEGSLLIITDTSPSVMIIPTGVFDFLQDTNDFYFPSLIGSYLRIVRMIVFLLALLLTPVWFLLIQNRIYPAVARLHKDRAPDERARHNAAADNRDSHRRFKAGVAQHAQRTEQLVQRHRCARARRICHSREVVHGGSCSLYGVRRDNELRPAEL